MTARPPVPDLLGTSLSGLLSFQRAMATTSHNVANVATEGFSRQRTELAPLPGQARDGGHVGAGVGVRGVERVRDQFVDARLREAIVDDGRARMHAELAGRLDALLGARESGLGPALSGFYAAVQDVADDPAGATPRRLLLGEARSLAERFAFLDARIQGLGVEMNERLEVAVAGVNALAGDIARLNRDIAIASGSGAAPNDLLDQRAQRVDALAALVGVRSVEQDNGALDVFSASGQALVVGTLAQRWQVVADPGDPSRLQVADATGGRISDKLSGGEIGGLLDFRRESLAPARNELGRLAVVLAGAVNAQHRAGMDANGALGEDLFGLPAPALVPDARNAGSASPGAAVIDATALTTSDYRLEYDGALWSLTRLADGAAVSGAGPLTLDGLEVSPGPGAAAGDRFLVRPAGGAAAALEVRIGDPDRVAAAAPVRAHGELANGGDAVLAPPAVSDAADGALLHEVALVFRDPPSSFDVLDLTAGTTLAAGVAYVPGTAIAFNGWSTRLDGEPGAGDRFRVEPNAGGIGDNRNALALGALQAGALVEGRFSVEEGYAAFVGGAGVAARSANLDAGARAQLLDDARLAREGISGVNLDEEAVDLTRYQQAYQAMARVMETANDLFDTLLAAVR